MWQLFIPLLRFWHLKAWLDSSRPKRFWVTTLVRNFISGFSTPCICEVVIQVVWGGHFDLSARGQVTASV